MVRRFVGNLFTRKVGNKMILVGIIDSPDDSRIPSEAMHTFSGGEYDDGTLHLETAGNPRDFREQARGMGIDNLLTSPIWRN